MKAFATRFLVLGVKGGVVGGFRLVSISSVEKHFMTNCIGAYDVSTRNKTEFSPKKRDALLWYSIGRQADQASKCV